MKTLLRILLTPFVFGYYILIVFLIMIFPLFIVLYAGSFLVLLSIPFRYILSNAGVGISKLERLYILELKSKPLTAIQEYLLIATFPAWLCFYGTYLFLSKAEFINLD